MGLCILGITTGILCGIWAEVATTFQLLSWAGFAGCTTYFAFNEHGIKGVKMSILCNMSGIISGMILIYISSASTFTWSGGVWCGIITLGMCLLGYLKQTSFIPGIFMGCFSTFAANGDWQVLAISMICGAVLGYLCDYTGTKGYEILVQKGILNVPPCNEETT